MANLELLLASCCSDSGVRLPQCALHIYHVIKDLYMSTFLAFWVYDCFQKKKYMWEYRVLLLICGLSGRFEPTTFLGAGIVRIRLHRQSNLGGMYYSLIIKTFSSVHFTTYMQI